MQAVVKDSIGAKLCATPDSYYNTPLHIAAKRGHLDAVRLLINNTLGLVKLDAKNDLGRTPMHLAAQFGNIR
jgi:ankyrin repeat protein